jgi:hypothetical protein
MMYSMQMLLLKPSMDDVADGLTNGKDQTQHGQTLMSTLVMEHLTIAEIPHTSMILGQAT